MNLSSFNPFPTFQLIIFYLFQAQGKIRITQLMNGIGKLYVQAEQWSVRGVGERERERGKNSARVEVGMLFFPTQVCNSERRENQSH